MIAATPAELRGAVRGLNDAQLDTPYRPDGWTVRQVVHHIPDSHANALIRFKLGLTENTPTIKPYDEAAWAKLEDARSTPIETRCRSSTGCTTDGSAFSMRCRRRTSSGR